MQFKGESYTNFKQIKQLNQFNLNAQYLNGELVDFHLTIVIYLCLIVYTSMSRTDLGLFSEYDYVLLAKYKYNKNKMS